MRRLRAAKAAVRGGFEVGSIGTWGSTAPRAKALSDVSIGYD
jgi:hypothetical protein